GICNLMPFTLSQINKIQFLLNPKEQINDADNPKPPNMFHQINNRELNGLSLEISKDFTDKLIIENIKEGNYTKTIFNVSLTLDGFDIQGNLAAIYSKESKEIKLWDLNKNKYLWTYELNKENYMLPLNRMLPVKISENHVFCKFAGPTCKERILLIYLKTG